MHMSDAVRAEQQRRRGGEIANATKTGKLRAGLMHGHVPQLMNGMLKTLCQQNMRLIIKNDHTVGL